MNYAYLNISRSDLHDLIWQTLADKREGCRLYVSDGYLVLGATWHEKPKGPWSYRPSRTKETMHIMDDDDKRWVMLYRLDNKLRQVVRDSLGENDEFFIDPDTPFEVQWSNGFEFIVDITDTIQITITIGETEVSSVIRVTDSSSFVSYYYGMGRNNKYMSDDWYLL